MRGLIHDARFGVRQLVKSPGFTLVAILTLALGIGANTALFSVVNGVLLQPLHFRDPASLVRIWHVPPAKSFPGISRFSVSAANYIDWERQNHAFESMAIYAYRGFTLTSSEKPERIDACAASGQFFETLGVRPLVGRTLVAAEDQPGRSNVVVLSYRLRQQLFASNPDVVGREITMDGQNFQVVGVMPRDFMLPEYAQLWTPMAWTDAERSVRGEHHSVVIARLRPGVKVSSAQAEMNTISSRLEQLYPADDKGWGAVVVPLQEDLVSDVRPAMLILLGAVALVLLIACVNVANLILGRSFSRQKEIAIRTALGASSTRIVRQVLTESVLLACMGGALGLTFAGSGVRLIMAFLAGKVPAAAGVRVDATALVFTAAISLLTGILAGVLPALRLSRKNAGETLKHGLGRTDTDSTSHRTRGILVVSEVALSLVLLVGAGLLVRSFQKLHRVNPGFDSQGVLTANLAVSDKKFPSPVAHAQFFEQVLERVRALPGVVAAGVVDDMPLDPGGSHQPIQIEGRPVVAMAEQPEVDVRLVSAGYMSALHIPILRGRDFSQDDVAGRPGAILISRSMAERFWPGENAVGKRLTMPFFPDAVREVVGVVGDVKLDGLDQMRPAVALYMPLDQVSVPSTGGWQSFPMTLVVRADLGSTGLASAVSAAVHQVDAGVPLRNVLTMDDVISESLAGQRFSTLLLGTFALVALLLAALGIYSVLSYNVKRRVSEIGIRLALGAQIRDVLRMVMADGMRPALLGLAVGVGAALGLGRLMSSLVYGVTPADPVTFVAVTALLALVALVATMIPAYRAARVDPNVALRGE